MSVDQKNKGVGPWSESTPCTKNDNLYPPIVSISEKNSNPEAANFLNLFTGGNPLTFQTFGDHHNGDKTLVRILHGGLNQLLPDLEELNGRGAGIFFTVNQTDLRGRMSQNIISVRALFVDLDGAPLEPVLKAPLPPHIVVETSPGRYHAYWLMAEVPIDRFSMIQKVLIKKFNADRAVHDLSRVMRLPGFFHLKKEPFLVKVIHSIQTPRYLYADFLNKFNIFEEISEEKSLPSFGVNHDPILEALYRRGMVKGKLSNKPGAWGITCFDVHLHTTGDEGTVYFEPNTNGYREAGFKCQHAHCEGKGLQELKKSLGLTQEKEEEWGTPFPLKEELLPVAPFEEEMLPEALRGWIMDCSDRMNVLPDFLAATCIVLLGSVIGRKAGLFPKAFDDWLVIPNLWGAIVGRPSLLKSPAISEMMKPLENLSKRALELHRTQVLEFQQKKMWYEALLASQKDEMKKAAKSTEKKKMPMLDNPIPPQEPKPRRYGTEDGTTEKIAELLLANPQGLLIHRDELTGWLKGLDKYGRESDRAFFLESWNGSGSYTVDRISRGTLHIPALCTSIIGGIQPGPLASYTYQATAGGNSDDGLLQRFQILVWPDVTKPWVNIDRPPNLAAKEKAYNVFDRLDEFAPFEPLSDKPFETQKFRFTPEAQILFDEWRAELEAELMQKDLHPAFESHLAKFRSLMPKLALIFYLVETLGNDLLPQAVDADSAKKAIRWCSYLKTHARRLYASGEDPGMGAARVLLDHIRRGDLPDNFSSRDIYHAKHWSRLGMAEEVAAALKILEDFGWVRTSVLKTGGRSSIKVSIHPSLRRGSSFCPDEVENGK